MWTDPAKKPIYDLNGAPITSQEESIAKNEPTPLTRFISVILLVLLAPFFMVFMVVVIVFMLLVAGISIPWISVVQFFIQSQGSPIRCRHEEGWQVAVVCRSDL